MQYNRVFRKELFIDKNIVITGGGSGIGRCIALGTCIQVDGGSPIKELAFQPLQKSDKHKPFDSFHLSKLPEVLEGKL